METTAAGVTVSRVDPLILARVAVIVAVPEETEVPSAVELMVATARSFDAHVAAVVRS